MGFFHKVGVVAELGVETRLTKVEDKLVEMTLKVVKMAIRVVIKHIFMQFQLIYKWQLLMW